MTKPLLKMENIDKQFPGVKALDAARLELKQGTVHALMGENGAGKSTLMKCLFGIYNRDQGTIEIEGEAVHFTGPKNALDHGVAMVHQELNQVQKRSVMENIWLGKFPQKGPFIDHKKMETETQAIFDELEIKLSPTALIRELSVSQRQMVEIAKAVSYDAKILVLDEPSSSLTANEVALLFNIINKLRDRGVGIIYISHKMDEILQISDEVTIMRDGKWIATELAKELTIDKIITLMVGRELSNLFPPKENVPGEIIFKVDNLSGKYDPTCHEVSFALRQGEILGVAGLVGARRTELLETIFGIATQDNGTMEYAGKKIFNKRPSESIKNGFAMLTEERRATGIFPAMNINFNSSIANLAAYSKGPLLNIKAMEEDTQWVIERMAVKTPSSKTKIRSLSGGNQQKVLLGRWLLTKPEILLLDEPTRGIDVGAKYEIYQLIFDLANENKGVIVVSSEMPELIGICDRILVMSNGKMAGIVDIKAEDPDKLQEKIMTYATKYL